jgi:hypothetical protein
MNTATIIEQRVSEKLLPRDPCQWVNPLLGRGKALGTKVTVDHFIQMKNEDRALEMERDTLRQKERAAQFIDEVYP